MAVLLRPPAMFERALNAFWILLGAAAAAYAWTLGLIGASGPESGLFPFLAGLIIMGAGVVLLLRPLSEHIAPDFPRGDGLWRVLGVIAGLAFMAISIPFRQERETNRFRDRPRRSSRASTHRLPRQPRAKSRMG